MFNIALVQSLTRILLTGVIVSTSSFNALISNCFGSLNEKYSSGIPKLLRSINDSTDSLNIQYVDVKVNLTLYSELEKFIKEQTDSSQLFRSGFGYISVGGYKINQFSPLPINESNNHKDDIVLSFNMSLNSYYITDDIPKSSAICHDCFPLYYSYVNGRLILIYDINAKWIHKNAYTSKSKKLISKLVRSTLTQALNSEFVFKDIYGKPLMLSEDKHENMSERDILEYAAFVFNKGKTYNEFYNGAVKYKY